MDATSLRKYYPTKYRNYEFLKITKYFVEEETSFTWKKRSIPTSGML